MGLMGVCDAVFYCLAQSMPGGFFEPEKRPQDQVFPIKIKRIGFRLLALDCFPQAGKLRKGSRLAQLLRDLSFHAQRALTRRGMANNPGNSFASQLEK